MTTNYRAEAEAFYAQAKAALGADPSQADSTELGFLGLLAALLAGPARTCQGCGIEREIIHDAWCMFATDQPTGFQDDEPTGEDAPQSEWGGQFVDCTVAGEPFGVQTQPEPEPDDDATIPQPAWRGIVHPANGGE